MFIAAIFYTSCGWEVEEVELLLPEGFRATIFADRVGAARHIVATPSGDVYVALWDQTGGGILALRDTDGDRRADLQERFADIGGSGIALYGDYLYFATWTTVYRYRLEAGELVPREEPQIFLDGLPRSGHAARSLTVDSEGFVYVNIAGPSNACQEVDAALASPGKDPCPELDQFGGIWKFDPRRIDQRQADGERIGRGLRHVVALATNPLDDRLYGVQHGRDHLIENWPDLYTERQAAENAAEEFFHIEKDADYGWPYCYYSIEHQRKVLAPEYGGNGEAVGRCADNKDPLYAFPAHWAPNALLFYTGNQFPSHYKGGAFIAFHGSWFRTG
ncbi:MAG TPA: PQQ-dependent sugar dehydrogenase, partial [Pyrinomonadaceae bacterium]|nr:PQQ-dependent sugar dehydrogenase [Pyrinomonadaceae bacterium]